MPKIPEDKDESKQSPKNKSVTGNFITQGMVSGVKLHQSIQQAIKSGAFGTFMSGIHQSHNTQPHLIIEAYAGTGKTSTLVEGVNRLVNFKKFANPPFKPTEEQLLIWQELQKGHRASTTYCFASHTRDIAEHIKTLVEPEVRTGSLHSLGFKILKQAFPLIEHDNLYVKKMFDGMSRCDNDLGYGIAEVVSMCKNNMLAGTQQDINHILSTYNILFETSEISTLYEWVPEILVSCLDRDFSNKQSIDYDDMIWLIAQMGHEAFPGLVKNDVLIIDEAQDLSKTQQEVIQMIGDRIVLCGDPYQSIFEWAGADHHSLDNMSNKLSDTEVGADHYCLNITQRCSRMVTEAACFRVPNLKCREEAIEGEVEWLEYYSPKGIPAYKWLMDVKPGDMILCRLNYPLIQHYLRFKRSAYPTVLLGKDLSGGVLGIMNYILRGKGIHVNQRHKVTTTRLKDWVNCWAATATAEEQTKKRPNLSRLILIEERLNTILQCCIGMNNAQEVYDAIVMLFKKDTEFSDEPKITLGSIHASKGLEANNVYLIQPKEAQCPYYRAVTPEQMESELNLLYVAYTRAKYNLYIVQ